jgi:hypothetical protein
MAQRDLCNAANTSATAGKLTRLRVAMQQSAFPTGKMRISLESDLVSAPFRALMVLSGP